MPVNGVFSGGDRRDGKAKPEPLDAPGDGASLHLAWGDENWSLDVKPAK
jgi:hypothetical protein